jgi:hypothetical protein
VSRVDWSHCRRERCLARLRFVLVVGLVGSGLALPASEAAAGGLPEFLVGKTVHLEYPNDPCERMTMGWILYNSGNAPAEEFQVDLRVEGHLVGTWSKEGRITYS